MTKAIVILIIALLSVSMLFSASTIPNVRAEQQYTLTVKVEDETTFGPITGANVTISGLINQSETTGADGTVVFRVISGTYTVVAYAPVYLLSTPQTVPMVGDTVLTIMYGHTKAFFTFQPSWPKANKSMLFNASLCSSSGIITNYGWDFGDDTHGTNVTTNHTYLKPGQYQVSLTVTSTVGAATYTQAITVYATNNPPIVIYAVIIAAPLILFPLLLFLFFHNRKYYVVIQVRVPPKHPHCPGNDSDCDNCKLTPC